MKDEDVTSLITQPDSPYDETRPRLKNITMLHPQQQTGLQPEPKRQLYHMHAEF